MLDVGPGRQATITFLNEFKARVFFADLFALDVSAPDRDASEAERRDFAQHAFEEALALSPDTLIDVCLLWDYLHCLDVPELRGLSAALEPHLHRDSRGYAFGALHANVELDDNDYAIHSIDQLLRKPTKRTTPHFPHTQRTLTDAFTAFSIVKGTLLREGRLELLLHAR